MKTGLFKMYEDDILAAWRDPKTRKLHIQGKRVKQNHPLTANERKIYVKQGAAACLTELRKRTRTIQHAIDLFKEARGTLRRYA